MVKQEIILLLNEVLKQTARLRKGGNELVYYCPSCKHHKRKLEVCLEDGHRFGWFNCWTCSISGGFKKLLRLVNATQSYYERLYLLTKDIKIIRGRNQERKDENKSEVSLPEEFRPISTPRNNPEYKNALAYLIRRGVIREDILRYNIGYCEEGPYENHIIVPSYDAKGILNFFIGRKYYEDNCGFSYKKPPYSMDIVAFESFINYNEPLNLCEGVFDALAIRNNAIPLFGKFPSRKLRETMILNGNKRVNMILDDDAMADSIKNCEMMMRLGMTVHLVYLNGKDPSVLGFDKIHNLIRESEEFTEEDLLRYRLQI